MSSLTQQANAFLVSGWDVVKKIDALVQKDPQAAELLHTAWLGWKSSLLRANLPDAAEGPIVRPMAALDEPRQTQIREAQKFLEANLAGLQAEGSFGSSAIQSLGEMIDALVDRGKYTVPAVGMVQGFDNPSIGEEVAKSFNKWLWIAAVVLAGVLVLASLKKRG